MSDHPVEQPQIPPMPWEIRLRSCVRHIAVGPDGGAVLAFTVAQPLPGGSAQLVAPQVTVQFSAEQWAKFQEEVANSGKRSTIVKASSLPPGLGTI